MKHVDVDSYIASQNPALIPMLEQIRSIIRSTVPQAEELISYLVPTYKLYGMFIAFGVRKSGCSLYAMNTGILSEFADELNAKGIEIAGSTLHFDPDHKLPVALIKKLVRARVQQNIDKNSRKEISNAKRKAPEKNSSSAKTSK